MEWLIYLCKVSACMALFYTLYHLFLQNLTFFEFNRVYLLSTILISFIIPALQLQVDRPAKQQVNSSVLPAVISPFNLQNKDMGSSDSGSTLYHTLATNWEQILFVSYLTIAVLLLLVFIFKAIQVLKHTRYTHQQIGRLKVIFKPIGFTNCSFLNYVFVDRLDLDDEEITVILQHEQVHANRYHTLDKLLLTVLRSLLWFNPFIYLYDKALEQVHEYEADRETSNAFGSSDYAKLLLNVAIRKTSPLLVHSFVKNPLKGRIKMLFTNPSKNMKKLTYLSMLPAALLLTWMFSVQIVNANQTVVVLKANYLPSKNVQEDTLRLIDDPKLGKNPEVIIDGKKYPAAILTKISPRCIKASSAHAGKIALTTRNNKIEYATAIDRENVRSRNQAYASNKLYIRYPMRNQDGSPYDEAAIFLKSKGSAGVSVPKGAKVLLLIDGKHYTENQARNLNPEQFSEMNTISANDSVSTALKAKYGKQYLSLLQMYKN